MKKTITLLLWSLCFVGASALTVSRPVKIDINGPAHNPTLSGDGKTMLFSSDDHTGLKLMNLESGKIIVLDESTGAGFHPIFSTDGKSVVYQTASLIDGLMNRDVRTFDLSSGETRQLAEMSRNDINLNELSGHTDYVTANYTCIKVAKDGETSEIRPIADAHSYLWASLSPDGSKIVFVEPFQGVFVCNPDGSDIKNIAKKGAFPAWAGNSLISYTLSHDDGYVVLDSTLKVYDLTTGITVDLTSADVIVGESTSAADGTVVYSTLEGEIYKINLKQ